ncbi:protein RRP5 homolog [Anopheles stephensi]|uniref:protein RRP5 homolog n=1 Tax=Anopheles stephensi TaxID=30069 RepID=UPI0016589658|nr:protein RRP5 homolog [Anopheles stephensi]
MLNAEPAFPRGVGGNGAGRVSKHGRKNNATKSKTSFERYGAAIFREQKVPRLRPKERHQVSQTEKELDEADVQQALTAENLSLQSLGPGMLVLGCVKLVSATCLDVVLPGRIKGNVPIANISNEYTAQLQEPVRSSSSNCPTLKDMYKAGDLIYVKVLEVQKQPHTTVTLSLKPSDLHSDFAPSQLTTGLVLAATIVAKEDHGYRMDVGIRNVRAFLPAENLGQNQTNVGRNLVCSVEQVVQQSPGATIVLKAFNPNTPWVLNVEEATLETIVPGCRLSFTVGEPVQYGLRGMLFDDTVPAYANELMLTKPTSTPQKYSMFKKLPATMLYMMPRTKQVFVSLRPYRNNRCEMDAAYGHGATIEKACVKFINNDGIWLQYGKKGRALIQRNMLLKSAAKSGNVDENVILAKFQIGTTHRVCVVFHDPLTNVCVVTNDPAMVDAEIRTAGDIIIGKTYNCRVVEKEGNKVLVTVGKARGSVEHELYDRKNPLNVNEFAKVRAVSRCGDLNQPSVRFTNHPLLLSEDAMILHDWDQLDATRKDQCFHGVVGVKKIDKILVKFFNNISGVLTVKHATDVCAKLGSLRVGDVAKFAVSEFDKNTRKLFLALPHTGDQVQPVAVDATITCIHATGVEVQTKHGGEVGTIPSECFSEFGEHNSLYMRLFHEGQTIRVMKTTSGTYSFRLKEYFKTHPTGVQSVVQGTLLKGSCITVNGVVYATPLLNNYSEQFEVMGSKGKGRIPDGSTIMMRVEKVEQQPPAGDYRMKVDTSLEAVCENGIDGVYEFVAAYMQDVDDLIQRYQERQYAFANYTIGQHVECVIEHVIPNSDKLAVEVHAVDKESKNVTKGIAVLPNQPATSYKVGTKVPGRIVWIDVERMLVHVCLDQSLFDRIPLNGNAGPRTTFLQEPQDCCVLFANQFVKVCCLQCGPAQLLIVPVKHHYNDWQDSEEPGNVMKVKLIKPIGAMVLAMLENMIFLYGSLSANKLQTGRHSAELTSQTSEETDDEDMDREESASNDNSSTSKRSLLLLGKNGKPKALKTGKLKRKLVGKELEKGSSAKAKETNGANGTLLPIKRKKKKTNEPFSQEEQETAMTTIMKLKEKQQTTKQSMLLVGKKDQATKSKLKKKKAKAFVIEQLDGADAFHLHQLDGVDDGPSGTGARQAKKRKHTPDAQRLPGATNFWDSTPVYKRSAADSSDDESDSSEQGEAVPKKRTTAKERFEAMKQEEERLRKIEEELANPSVDPHTPDQFDRLVLAQPNNSMLWIRYMVFHMESAELEKARAVGRRALKAIHFREETDRLNVWVALLNLEIRYETVDSFKDVLQEAIQYNDAFKVYTRVIDILIDCQKHTEVQELLELLLKKFRKQNGMWYLVADAWYRIGQGSKVKPLLSQALKSLPTRDHIPLIVKFAFLHNRNENRDEAHLLFEQILTSYPKRTDIWSQYIDMLVKDNLVGNARQILERAIMQRLPLKNMKTLYTKYVNFEEKHGDRDSVRRVKQMAADFVQAQLNNAGIKS